MEKNHNLLFIFRHMDWKRKKFLTLFLLILISLTMIKCSKEDQSPFLSLPSSKRELQLSPKLIKENFYKLKLDTGFKANSQKGISWTPDWENPDFRKVNDSVSYVYFKLKGSVIRDGKSVPITEMNAATFLMVKNGKEYYRAFYESSLLNSKNSVPEYSKLEMQIFTGSLILSNLENKQHYLLKYTNGQLDDSYRKQGNKTTTKKLMSIPGSVSSWETQCYTTIAHCTFVSDSFSRCGGDIMVLYSASCIWPNQICGVNFSLTDYREVDICQDIWFPDPPTESGGGGGTGGTEEEEYGYYDGNHYNDFDNNTDWLGPTQLIPSTITLDNGQIVNIIFGSTKDLVSANQPVATRLVDALKATLNLASSNVTIHQIYIKATTNGIHGPESNHFRKLALDISKINGSSVLALGPNNPLVVALQNAFENVPNRRENFGPAFERKWGQPWPVGDHEDHLHFSVDGN